MNRWQFDRERRERERSVDARPTGSAGRVRRDERGVGLEASVEMLLAGLGLLPAAQMDAVLEAASRTISSSGLEAEVRGVRFGALSVVTSPAVAALLKWHTDTILMACETAVPGAVREVRILTR